MELNISKILIEMERLGWNQSELARRMDVDRQLVHRFLKNGTGGITIKTIDKIADALGLDPKVLLK